MDLLGALDARTGVESPSPARLRASDLVRRVQAGDEITITVSGRPSARLVPVSPATQWRSWFEIAELFRGPDDPAWEQDRQFLDSVVRDPWAEQ